MALARTRRSESGMNYWPGFVDALSTLILSIIFILTVFVVVQFYLQQEIAGKDAALGQLNTQITQLTELLSMEKTNKTNLENQLAQLRASLAGAETDRDRLKGVADAAGAALTAAEGKAAAASAALTAAQGKTSELSGQVESEKKISAGALSQVEILNQQILALRRQLAAIEASLDISEKKDKESQAKIADLGQRLNLAMAQKVQELTKYRSDFFGRLREILGNRPDIRIVGDRFVLQSELLFESGKADLRPEARVEIDKIAAAILELSQKIPPDIAWVLRVDGHTDIRPITGPIFKSNWDLSAARAIAVVKYLAGKSIAPEHLVAAGFGEYQPIDTAKTDDAYQRNRRIEFKLTER